MTRVCRICMEKSPKHKLIAPCKCKGTSKWVHRECVETWRRENKLAFLQCSVCKFEYELDLSVDWSKYRLSTCWWIGVVINNILQVWLGIMATLYVGKRDLFRGVWEATVPSWEVYVAFIAVAILSCYYSVGHVSVRWGLKLISYFYDIDYGYYPGDWRHWGTGQNKLSPIVYFCFVVLGVLINALEIYWFACLEYKEEENRQLRSKYRGRVKDLSRPIKA
jgi:hypothetical protein